MKDKYKLKYYFHDLVGHKRRAKVYKFIANLYGAGL